MSAAHNQFIQRSLSLEDLNSDPRIEFSDWLDEYFLFSVSDNVTMSFSTINQEGFPSSRIVYLRDCDANGFVFYTNYDSNKGAEIRNNNKASMLFYWPEMERQVRIWGLVKKVKEELSDAYFKVRPKESQAGAWVSRQSNEIKDRIGLENMHRTFLRNVGDKVIPRPEFWGGYHLTPVMYEFWQGRASRLHDRFLYKKHGESWEIIRLAP